MTRAREFKQAVRARMAQTGERYTAARAHLLEEAGSLPGGSGRPFDYPLRPGVCADTGVLRNWLEASGAVGADDGPIGETLLTGLAGGVGFLYMVFEYTDLPPMLSVLTRFDSAADRFGLLGLERLGLDVDHATTGSANKAQEALDAALDAGRPALCVVDQITLWQPGGSAPMAGSTPTLVAVIGRDGDDVLVDVGGTEPARLDLEVFAQARAGYRKAKHHLVTVAPGQTVGDLAPAIADAIAECADRYINAPYKGFSSNMGFAGMEKWSDLLVDERNKKGWPKLFGAGDAACFALRRAYQGVHYELTPPSAGRAMYASFLRQASTLTDRSDYVEAARCYDDAAAEWDALAAMIALCGVGAVESGCELLDAYAELLDSQALGSDRAEVAEMASQLSAPRPADDLDPETALDLFGRMSAQLVTILAAERAAQAKLVALGACN